MVLDLLSETRKTGLHPKPIAEAVLCSYFHLRFEIVGSQTKKEPAVETAPSKVLKKSSINKSSFY